MKKIIAAAIGLLFLLPALADDIKDADLAGIWYPNEAGLLSRQIDEYLVKARPADIDGRIIALISPHAGLIYSGPIAAWGFKAVQKQPVDTVIVAGFSHRMGYDGIAVFEGRGIKTPLGVLNTDRELARQLTAANSKLVFNNIPFQQENSIEMIIPFIQKAMPRAKAVFLAMGDQTEENIEAFSQALYDVLKDKKNFLMIASTDLSHYLSREEAVRIDSQTAELIRQMDSDRLFSACRGKNRMCGPGPLAAVIKASRRLGADRACILKQGDSSRAGAGKRQVVGYLSAVLVQTKKNKQKEQIMEQLLTLSQKKELLRIARQTVSLFIREKKVYEPQTDDPRLKEVMGVFVTLHKKGALRGCIGNIVGSQPLYLGVRDMAIASSTEDPRFPPVKEEEIDMLDIELSVLSPLKKVSGSEEIVLGRHGVLVRSGYRSGVYLPQVAGETGWDKEQFLSSLCAHKAGLPSNAWKTGHCEMFVFTAEVFGEK